MELLSPNELEIVTRFNDKAETAYVLAIKRLLHATDTNTAICAMILSGFDEIRTTLTESEIVHLGRGYDDVFSRLHALFIDLKNHRTSVGQDLLNARHDLILGLSAARAKWVNSVFEEQESWFSEKTDSIESIMRLYADDIASNTRILDEVQGLKAHIWLAVSHSKMIHNHLGMR